MASQFQIHVQNVITKQYTNVVLKVTLNPFIERIVIIFQWLLITIPAHNTSLQVGPHHLGAAPLQPGDSGHWTGEHSTLRSTSH